MEKQCKTCEFNFNGTCAEYNSLYGYGNKIIDNTTYCDCWAAGIEYFTDMMKNAPRFLLEKYNEFKKSRFSKRWNTRLFNYGRGWRLM